jgi:hypothetical protein
MSSPVGPRGIFVTVAFARLELAAAAPASVPADQRSSDEFPGLGHRTMLLNARKIFSEGGTHTTILFGIEDVTAQRILEREKDELLRQKDMLFEEQQHRVSNSLQIIASIILMKARAVQSEETRHHLCMTRTSVSCRLPRKNSFMHPGILGPLQLRLIYQVCARASRPQ